MAMKMANGVLKNASMTYAGLFGSERALGRSFIELRAAEPPATINVFPAPGTYQHPVWGDLEVTQAGNQQFVDHFNDHVYQEHVAIDAEHESKLSGAVGYIKALAMNDDGSIEAEVEWNERGVALIEQDAYKYISPEWYETWKDPASGDAYDNVLIGAALTTRPFFKDLRALVASEGRLYDVDDHGRTPLVRSTAEHGMSYGDLQEAVMSAARHAYPGMCGQYGGWIVDIWDDYAILNVDTHHYRIDFTATDAGVELTSQPVEVHRKTMWEEMEAREFSNDMRTKLAEKGHAMPDGAYPIMNQADLSNAVKAYGRAKDKEAVKKHIIKRAKALGKTNLLPADWPGSAKKKEDRMAIDVKDLEIDKLEEKDQMNLFQRLASTLKATVSFGGGGENEDKEDEETKEDDKPEDKSEDGDKSEDQPEAAKTAAEITSLKGTLAQETEARKAAEKRLAGLEATSRTQRLRDIILGRDEPSVRAASESSVSLRPMVGDLDGKMTILSSLEEGSPAFKAYIASEREHANQLHQAGLFNETGVDAHGDPVPASAKHEFDQRVEVLIAKEPTLTKDQAIARVASEEPQLYQRYDKEITGRRGGY